MCEYFIRFDFFLYKICKYSYSNLQVSFTISPDNPGRIGILGTMTIALVNIFMSVRTSSPTASANTVSSIGLWLIFCLIFVIFCLVEYGIILYLKYLSSKRYSEDEFASTAKKIDRISLFSSPLIIALALLTVSLLHLFSNYNIKFA